MQKSLTQFGFTNTCWNSGGDAQILIVGYWKLHWGKSKCLVNKPIKAQKTTLSNIYYGIKRPHAIIERQKELGTVKFIWKWNYHDIIRDSVKRKRIEMFKRDCFQQRSYYIIFRHLNLNLDTKEPNLKDTPPSSRGDVERSHIKVYGIGLAVQFPTFPFSMTFWKCLWRVKMFTLRKYADSFPL